MMKNGCETGCMTYTGGEKKHDKNCQYYPESLTKMYDDLLNEVKNLRLHNVVGSYNLKVGDNIKLPSGLKAEVIKTKVKVKDEFGGEYYLSDIEVG